MEKKKLELKKQTIVALSDSEAAQVKGGVTWTITLSSYECITFAIAATYIVYEYTVWRNAQYEEVSFGADPVLGCIISDVNVFP